MASVIRRRTSCDKLAAHARRLDELYLAWDVAYRKLIAAPDDAERRKLGRDARAAWEAYERERDKRL